MGVGWCRDGVVLLGWRSVQIRLLVNTFSLSPLLVLCCLAAASLSRLLVLCCLAAASLSRLLVLCCLAAASLSRLLVL